MFKFFVPAYLNSFEMGESIMWWICENILFVLTYLFSSILLATKLENKSLYITVITMIMTPLFGYFHHVISHNYDFQKLAYGNNEMSTLTKTVVYLLNFHSQVHHNTLVNTKSINLIIEGFQNLLNQGFVLILINKLLLNDYLVNNVIALYAFLYTTIHLVNYNLYKSKAHENHHKDPYTNYGPYLFDILFNTADEEGKHEDWNIVSINVIIITTTLFVINKYSLGTNTL